MRFLRIAALLFSWSVTAIAMAISYLRDPYSPLREDTAAYGHNHEGALWQGLLITAVELVIVGLILRPWSYQRAWWRALGALGLLVPWTLFSALMVMHAGGILAIHFLWVLGLTAATVVVLLWSIVASVRLRPEQRA